MAEGQFFFWIWNQHGSKPKQPEDILLDSPSKTSHTGDLTANLSNDVDIADTALLGDTHEDHGEENIYTNVEDGMKDSEQYVVITTDDEIEKPPAYMVEDEYPKDDDDDDRGNTDYDFATMSTVKDKTVLKFQGDLQSPPETASVSEMAIHTDVNNFTVRRNTKSEEKKNSNGKNVCMAIICLVIVLLVAAIALFLLVFLWSVIGKESDERVVVITTPESGGGRGDYLTVETPPIDLIFVNLSIILQRDYLPVYNPTSSLQFKEFATEITDTMNTFFEGSSHLKDVYDKTDVSQLSNDTGQTLKADLVVFFNDSPIITIMSEDNESDDMSEEDILSLISSVLEDIIADMFLEADNLGSLDDIDYVKGSAEVQEPLIVLSSTTTLPGTSPSFSTGGPLSTDSRITTERTELPVTTQNSSFTTDRPTTRSTPSGTTLPQGCTGFECGSGECISASLECDKTVDCSDNSDELNCTHDCTEICPNRLCIQPNDNCDGLPQCSQDTQSLDEYEQANCSYGCLDWTRTTAVPCELPYNQTYFPNFISKGIPGFGNIIHAELQLRQLYRYRVCDRRAIQLFCGAVFPGCPLGPNGTVAICKGFCEDLSIKLSCVEGFATVGINLADMCQSLPTLPIDDAQEFCTYF